MIDRRQFKDYCRCFRICDYDYAVLIRELIGSCIHRLLSYGASGSFEQSKGLVA